MNDKQKPMHMIDDLVKPKSPERKKGGGVTFDMIIKSGNETQKTIDYIEKHGKLPFSEKE